ncbi:hypothetical protein [Paenibacillus puerhi]|uniref:hypothetical protein n=1 Tax=Paenibacillus puerhi TaxID=2692622 RepID=UPI0013579FE0|nr:hypothetical protein [Paenibacillus puerhi]
MEKYVGRTVEIIYMGRNNRISQRVIEIRHVEAGVVKAYCLTKRAPRIFLMASILAVQPVPRAVVS